MKRCVCCFMLVCIVALFLVCLTGCGEIGSKDFLNKLQKDAAQTEKLNFSVFWEKQHNELANSGLYNNSEWQNSCFRVHIIYNLQQATEAQWYKSCVLHGSAPTVEIANYVFFKQYQDNFKHGSFRYFISSETLELVYFSDADLKADYKNIKNMAKLSYVTSVEINYVYGLPTDSVADVLQAAVQTEKMSFSMLLKKDHALATAQSGIDNCGQEFFALQVTCDFSLATEEQWYKTLSKSNQVQSEENFYLAFANYYRRYFPHGFESSFCRAPGNWFEYGSVAEFLEDFNTIQTLLKLPFVTGIKCERFYGLTEDYVLNTLKTDARNNAKLNFLPRNQELHNQMEQSDLYQDSEWGKSWYVVLIQLDEEMKNQEWFQAMVSANPSLKERNECPLYTKEQESFRHGYAEKSQRSIILYYTSHEALYTDYLNFRQLTDVEGVQNILIEYYYSLPKENTYYPF